jgi:protein arginine kinase activator
LICQNCNKNEATIHVTDVYPVTEERPQSAVNEHHLCEICAQTKDLPHTQSPGTTVQANVWKLLQITAEQKRRREELKCKGCGMSVDEFRNKGRLGCAECYEVFRGPIAELLERVHGAMQHIGRVPGLSDDDLERMQRLSELRRELDAAVREEAYESAAGIRDEIDSIEMPKTGDADIDSALGE